MQRSALIWLVLLLAPALAITAGCGDPEEDLGAEPASSQPAVTPTPTLPPWVDPDETPFVFPTIPPGVGDNTPDAPDWGSPPPEPVIDPEYYSTMTILGVKIDMPEGLEHATVSCAGECGPGIFERVSYRNPSTGGIASYIVFSQDGTVKVQSILDEHRALFAPVLAAVEQAHE